MSPRFQYSPNAPQAGSIEDLLLRRGQIQGNRARTVADAEARAARARGQIWGQTIGSIGDLVGGGIQSYARERAAARSPERALDLATKAADLRLKETQIAEAGQKGDERDRLTRQDTAFMALLERGETVPKEVLAIYGPQKGVTVLNGLKALQDLQKGEVADARETAGRLALGLQQLSPALRTQAWPQIRELAIKAGLGDAETIPPEPTSDYLKAIVAWATGKEPATPELMNVPPGGAVLDPTTRQPVFTNPRAEGTPTEASLAAAAAAGDPQAREALRLLQQQRAAGQQERAGYFTMQPVYDAQGRPVGAIKLNARSGETAFVKPDEMGGVTARPPGNLGQRTVENEAAIDSLTRLKQMFDSGASADIGPAEGRSRRTTQSLPGGVATMEQFGQDTKRFADFEAGSRAFQNAMIKAITGAQMSEPEAKRIMAQIPAVTDHPTVWQAKYTQSVKNLEDLENRTRQDRDAPATPGGGGDADPLGLGF